MKKLTLIALAFLALNLNAQTGSFVYNSFTNSATFICTGCSTTYYYNVTKKNGTPTTYSATTDTLILSNAGDIILFAVSNSSSSGFAPIWTSANGLPVELIYLKGNIVKTPIKNTIYILPNKTKVIFLDN